MIATIANTRVPGAWSESFRPEEHEARLRLVLEVQRGSREAQKDLIESCLPLLNRLARVNMRTGVVFEDLVAEGAIALVRAAHSYNPASGVPFTPYAATWVKHTMRGFERKLKQVIRIPGHVQTKLNRIESVSSRIESTTGRKALPSEIARETGLSESVVLQVASLRGGWLASLDAPRPGGEVPDASDDTVSDPAAGREQLHGRIRTLLSGLSPEERALVIRRFGLGCQQPGTIKDLARQLNLAPRRVQRALDRAMRQLRTVAAAGPANRPTRTFTAKSRTRGAAVVAGRTAVAAESKSVQLLAIKTPGYERAA